MKIVLATKNEDKIREIKKILKVGGLEILSLRDFSDYEVVEDGDTFYANARKKAFLAASFTNLPALSDDSGLVVASLGGLPGIYSARYSGKNATYESNIRKLLRELRHCSSRAAKFVCVCVLYFPDGRIFSTRGELQGLITKKKLGSGGFGYDPVFYVRRLRRTLAEIPPKLKNEISHRGIAFRKMAEIIKSEKVKM
ncbi:MAG: RdgB/HAM1 family non-canonical purine NTP pyrophosphatase [Elusimicrobia bacterium]|nr:RdgB/HAM1 family non-canonical purine NTP pyrophosphatase [Elusimicrobiota bacterium]